MIEVNLLPPTDLSTRQEKALGRKLFVAALGTTAVFLIGLGGLIGTDLFLKRLSQNRLAERDNLRIAIEERSLEVDTLRLIKERIQGVVAARSAIVDFSPAIRAIFDKTAAGKITGLTVNLDGSFTTNVEVTSEAEAGRILSGFATDERGEFQAMRLASLRLAQNGYAFALGGKYVGRETNE
jgi:hypothetical protein